MFKPVENVCFGRTVQSFCDLRDYSIEKTEDELKNLISKIKSSGQDIAAIGAFLEPSHLDIDDDDVQRRTYVEATLCFDSLYEDELASQSLEELIEIGRGVIWRFSAEDCHLVEGLTRKQSFDPLWFKLRYGRVTASTFSKCVKTNIQRPSITLIKSICGVGKKQEFPAILYGKQNEHKAIAAAVKIFKQEKHDNFKGRKCGLVISPDYPYFAASPDFFFECDCCKLVVVEAKCPFKLDDSNRDAGINSLLNRQHPYITQDTEGNIVMNHKHEYYFQIQMQMFLSKATYGIFVVWAPKFTLFLKEQKDYVFWEENEERAARFFKSVLTPEILSHYFTCPRLPQ